VKREDLFFALNETTHALRFAQAAANRFTVDPDELEAGSPRATSIAFISNQLTDAQTSLSAAEVEISNLMEASAE
jgi:uncharacterized protein (DUF1810 family)